MSDSEFTSLEEWWGKHLADYHAAFECLGTEFDAHADVTSFIQAHIRAQVSQVRALDLREQVERRIWTVIEDMVADAGCDRRVANAAWDAFFGREVTAGYYRPLADISAATATKDLALAVAAGLLERGDKSAAAGTPPDRGSIERLRPLWGSKPERVRMRDTRSSRPSRAGWLPSGSGERRERGF